MFKSLVLASLVLSYTPVLAVNDGTEKGLNTDTSVVATIINEIRIENQMDPLTDLPGKIKLILIEDRIPESKNSSSVKPVVKPTKSTTKSSSSENIKPKPVEKKSDSITTSKPKNQSESKEQKAAQEIILKTEPAVKPVGTTITPENTPAAITTPKVEEPIKENTTPTIEVQPATIAEVKELIRKYSLEYQVDEAQLMRVAECESGFKSNLVGLGRYFGVFQFSKPTFNEYAKKLNLENPDPLNAEQNVKLAAYMFSLNQSYRWGCK